MSRFCGRVSSATFIANGHRYTQGPIDDVHLLHYKYIHSQHSETERLQHQHHAELILHPSVMSSGPDNDQEMSRLIVHSEFPIQICMSKK